MNVLTCNVNIDGVISGRNNKELCVDFLIAKGICFLPLFGAPFGCMIAGLCYNFDFYIDLAIGFLSYLLYLMLYHCQWVRCRDHCKIKNKLMPKEEKDFALMVTKQKSIELNGM